MKRQKGILQIRISQEAPEYLVETAVVFGGAGFIGRSICRALVACGWRVFAVDGLMKHTSADEGLVRSIEGIDFVRCVTDEEYGLVENLVKDAALVIDSMGWTKHLDAIRNPMWDLRLNVASHLPLIRACLECQRNQRLIIYLASSHQYGKSFGTRLTEDANCLPTDIQGIHKLTAEHHWRVAADRSPSMSVISLRFGNTFGPGMPIGSGDIGLIGGFFRAARLGEKIRVFGSGRRRNIVFSEDLSNIIVNLASMSFARGFHPMNVDGHDVSVKELAQAIIEVVGAGSLIEEPTPNHIRDIDVGEAILDDSKLNAVLGLVAKTELGIALAKTYSDLQDKLCLNCQS